MLFTNPYFQAFLVTVISMVIVFLATRRNITNLHVGGLVYSVAMLGLDVYNFAKTFVPDNKFQTSVLFYIAALITCNFFINMINKRKVK